ncbi:MAG TPA: penicillin-binding transpeptidase domain-containing protein [Solirubrobacteraceae bacterium]|nr:penicillin-binding transpeptidase domain-containing protein [Solirubrobacteraceae bacterium]
MNAPILKLFVLVLVLFGALAAMTSYNSVIKAEEYRENALNKRPLIKQALVKRGVIRARDGSLLARSVKGDDDIYRRRYTPAAERFSHALGYDYALTIGRAGLERSRNDALAGETDELTSIVDGLRGSRKIGDNVVTNLDPAAQKIALDALGDRRGSVVAIEPATGKVRVMASTPGYDPNALRDEDVFERLNRQDNSPLFNRATQAGYVPGSTMKVVTAAAALDSGEFSPESQVVGKSPINVSGVPLSNFSNAQFGSITLTTALTNSVNTVWAQVAERLGDDTYARYMNRFGFGSDPPLDYPDGQMLPSGVYDMDKQEPIAVDSGRVDIGRVAIGQERLRVTPLQMATVVATVANGGMRMQPRLTSRIVDADGRTVERIGPAKAQRVISQTTAAQLTQMMANVVREGTGTAAALQGIEVAGKTGTAELNIAQRINQPWFVGFAPRSKPKVAIAVTLENLVGAQGGTDAAPIAKQVMESLLR